MRGAAMIVEDRVGRILLLQRGPAASWMPYRWNLPGGHVETGETTAQAAARETFEETSLVVGAVSPIIRMRVNVHVIDVFYAEEWSGRVRIDHESIDYVWVPRSEAWQSDLIPPQRDALRWFASRS